MADYTRAADVKEDITKLDAELITKKAAVVALESKLGTASMRKDGAGHQTESQTSQQKEEAQMYFFLA